MKQIMTKKLNRVLALVLTIAALVTGQTAMAVTTWTVTNPTGSKFRITRPDSHVGTTETVKCRTVNLSAYAGQHYTAVSGEVTFEPTDTYKEVTVTERTPAADAYAYKYQTDTKRKYRFEVTDLGGFELHHCDREITTGTQFSNAKVSKSITNLVYFSGTNYASGVNSSKYVDVSYTPPSDQVETSGTLSGYVLIDDSYDYTKKAATVSTSDLVSTTGANATYLNNIGYKIYATVCFTEKERDDGYQYIQIIAGDGSASYDGADSNGKIDNGPTNSVYKTCFELSDNSNAEGKAYFPHRGTTTSEFSLSTGKLWQQKFKSEDYNGSGAIVLDPTVSNITTRFDAGGDNDDTWGYKDFFVRMALVDASAPTKLAVSVAPGRHSKGNTVYVSVAFNEIVTVTGTPMLTTTSANNWGSLSYVEGSGSNVLTFSTTIPANASGNLNITGLSGTVKDLAGNDLVGSGVTATGLCSLDANYAYTITYNLDEGSVATANPTTYTYETATFTLNNPTRTGYTFDGWTGSNGNTPSTSVTIANHSHGNKSYTATWTAHTYTLRLHHNDGTDAYDDVAMTYDAAHTLPAFTRTGYVFNGWNTQADGSGTAYIDGQSVSNLTATNGGEVNLYAQWTTIENVPLTLRAIADGEITVSSPKSGMQYSKNRGTKAAVTASAISVSAGDIVEFYGNGTSIASYNGTNIQCSADCYIYGNIMSLVDEAGFATNTTLTEMDCFKSLFYNNTHLKNHSNNALVLPAMTLTQNCYGQMFYGCTGLTTAPALPATTLASTCYSYMFYGCTGLTAAPALPATTLANYCYSNMFYGCTSLTAAPALPATTLANYCYSNMFYGCTSLTTAPALPATTLAYYCYYSMFSGCTSLTAAPELPATTLAHSCYNNMFNRCYNLTTAPALPATMLADYCYDSMFQSCTSLTAAPELPATTLAGGCYSYMFRGCTSLNYVVCLATDRSAGNCTDDWLDGVAGSGTFVKAAGTSWDDGASGIPSGWTTKDYLPLTLEAIADGSITVSSPKSGMQYSINGGDKTPVTASAITVSASDIVQFYGKGTSIASYNGTNIQCSADCYIYGNIMSLVDETDFPINTTLTETRTFSSLFQGNTHIKNHSDHPLVLPATTLTSACYENMFKGCYNLTTAPALPATTLADGCYRYMFAGTGLTAAPELPATTLAERCYMSMFFSCGDLTTAPVLPATTLAEYCYYEMFYNCTNLTTAPVLPATTLAEYCYHGMFNNCTNLNYVECLATDRSASNCTSDWLRNVASSGTFMKAARTDWASGASGIPSGWTTKEILPLTLEAIANGSITVSNPKSGMQYSINGGDKTPVTASAITVSAGDIVEFYGNGTSIASYYGTQIQCSADCYIYGNIMSLVDEYGFATNTTLTETYTFTYLFRSNTHLKNHSNNTLVLPATTLAQYCYKEMFNGCTNLSTAPALPATTLANYCYEQMFRGCTSLNYVICLASDRNAQSCTSSWLNNVAGSGTFVMVAGTSWNSGTDGIPSGWTVVEALRDNADNSAAIEALADNNTHNIMLYGRTLYRDGDWNTLCLPFEIPLDNSFNTESNPLYGATVMSLDPGIWYDSKGGCYGEYADGRHRSGEVDASGNLYLYFLYDVSPNGGFSSTQLRAGDPYIVKWETTDDPIVNPVFQNVTVTRTTPDYDTTEEGPGNVNFYGTYAPVDYTAADHSILFLGTENTLYYPQAGAHIGAFRAYFELGNGLTVGDPESPVKAFNLNFGEERPTLVSLPLGREAAAAALGAWYTIDGRKIPQSSILNHQLPPGLYIHNGRKVVIK